MSALSSSSSSSDDETVIIEDLMVSTQSCKVFRVRQNPLEHYNDNEFLTRYRFSKKTFLYVHTLVANAIKPKDLNRGLAVTSEQQLLIALRYYATGAFQIVCGDLVGITQPTVCNIIKRVTHAIAKLASKYIKMPNESARVQTARKFNDAYQLPRVMGLIDGTHIPCQSPGGDNAELFRNRKGFFSVNCQVVTDADLKIIDIVAR